MKKLLQLIGGLFTIKTPDEPLGAIPLPPPESSEDFFETKWVNHIKAEKERRLKAHPEFRDLIEDMWEDQHVRGRPLYRCRACGAVELRSYEITGWGLVEQLVDISTGQPSYIGRHSIHRCSETRMGLMELIGADFVVPDKPESDQFSPTPPQPAHPKQNQY